MYKLNIIETGYIMADGGAMFGTVPKRAWQRKYQSDENNLCPLAMRCVLAISDTRRIVTDTGMGDKHLDKISYYQPHKLTHIKKAVEDLGYSCEEITDVILTHLHFDHCGGATIRDINGNINPTFPHARYWLSKKQWENSLAPNRLEADSIFENSIHPILDTGILHLIEEDTQIDNNCYMRLFDGHSEGQIVAYFNTEDGIYTFPGDLIPTAAHVPLEWISAYDISAVTAIKEKERFLTDAVQNRHSLIYCHDNMTQVSRIIKLNDNYKAEKK